MSERAVSGELSPLPHRSWRFRASGLLKSVVFGVYGLPYSRDGLDAGLAPFLPAGKPITLLDIGASAGDFTAVVNAHCGIRRALLAEPQPDRCRALATRFRDQRFTVRQCAVGDRPGSIEMAVLNSDYSSSIFDPTPGLADGGSRIDISVRERITVPMMTLDQLVDEAGLGDIDLLKLDTQGAEALVLRGAERVLPRVRLIWTEVSFRRLYEGAVLFHELHDLLAARNFRLYSIHDGFRGADGELLQADALFLAPSVHTPIT